MVMMGMGGMGDGENGRWGDGRMGDGEIGRMGDGENIITYYLLLNKSSRSR